MAFETHYRQLFLTNACHGMRCQRGARIAASLFSLLHDVAGGA